MEEKRKPGRPRKWTSDAERMRATDEARAAYAVLAVHPRRAESDAPDGMDLLIDPVHLCESEQIRREDDTYRMRYRLAR